MTLTLPSNSPVHPPLNPSGPCSYGLLRFGVSAGSEIQRLVYLRVKEVAYKCVARG